jgi:hypothetical protein
LLFSISFRLQGMTTLMSLMLKLCWPALLPDKFHDWEWDVLPSSCPCSTWFRLWSRIWLRITITWPDKSGSKLYFIHGFVDFPSLYIAQACQAHSDKYGQHIEPFITSTLEDRFFKESININFSSNFDSIRSDIECRSKESFMFCIFFLLMLDTYDRYDYLNLWYESTWCECGIQNCLYQYKKSQHD